MHDGLGFCRQRWFRSRVTVVDGQGVSSIAVVESFSLVIAATIAPSERRGLRG